MFKDTTVPLIVKPGAPGVNVVPAIARAVGPAVMTCPSMVVVIGSAISDGLPATKPPIISPAKPVRLLGRGTVLEPTISWPAVLRETSVPPIVTPEAPGVKAVPAMDILSGAAVMTWPSIVVIIEFGDADSRGMVFEPTISWLAVSKDSSVPSSVMPGAPGVRTVPATVTAFGAAVIAWPATFVVIVSGTFDARGIVLEPTTNCPAVSRDIIVPSIAVPGAPGLRVLPAIATAFGAAVIAWPAIVVISVGTPGARGIVDVPTTRADEPKWIGVPDTVIGGDPLVRVVPASATASDKAVITWPAIVAVTGFGSPERGTVDVPIMRADEPKYIGVPDTVIGGAPGVKVVPATEMP